MMIRNQLRKDLGEDRSRLKKKKTKVGKNMRGSWEQKKGQYGGTSCTMGRGARNEGKVVSRTKSGRAL